MLPPNGVIRLSSVICQGKQHARHTAGLSCDRMIRHTRRSLRIPFTLGVCKRHLHCCTDGNTRYVILVDVTQTLTCFDSWSSVYMTREEQQLRHTWLQSATARADSSQWEAVIAAGEREPWRNSSDFTRKLGLPEARVLEIVNGGDWHPRFGSYKNTKPYYTSQPTKSQFKWTL
jgi:hypothetical protein